MRLLRWLLQIAVTGALLALLARLVDLGVVARAIANADPTLFITGSLLMTLSTVFMAWRWQLLLRQDGADVTLSSLTATCLESTFLGFFLPSGVGGDLLRGMRVHGALGGVRATAVNLIADRLIGLWSICLLGAICVAVDDTVAVQTRRAVWLSCAGVACVSALLIQRTLQNLVGRVLQGLGLARLASLHVHISSQLSGYFGRSQRLGTLVGLSICQHGVAIAATYLAALAAGVDHGLLFFAAVMPVIWLLSLIPALGGLGPREAGLVFVLVEAGTEHGAAAAAAGLAFATMLARGFVGAAILMIRGIGKGRDDRENPA